MSMPKQKRGKSKQDYQTPPELVVAVKRFYGIEKFSIDLAADACNTQADAYYDEADNSLAQLWKTPPLGFAWLNPPYADIKLWVKKAYESRLQCQTLMLLPASVGANWYKDFVSNKAQIWFLNGRVTFVGCEDAYPKDCMLLHYGATVPVLGIPNNLVWSWKN